MSNIYGYCRISTKNQNIDRQERNIREAYPNVEKIYKEAYSGRKIARPEWTKLSKRVDAGDVIVFDEVSRMSRNAEEGFRVYNELFEKGVDLVFLKESYVNTDSYKEALKGAINIDVNSGDKATDELVNDIMKAVNRFMMIKLKQDIYAAFESAQKEVDYLSQRTKEGIKTAKLNGKAVGRKKGVVQITKKSINSKEGMLKYSSDFYGTNSDVEVMKILGISKNSYYKYKKQLRNDIFLEDGTLIERADEEPNKTILAYAKNLIDKM